MQVVADPEHSGNEDRWFLCRLRLISADRYSSRFRLLHVSQGCFGKRCQATPVAQVDDAHAARPQCPFEALILLIDSGELTRQRMPAGPTEKMIVGEIDA